MSPPISGFGTIILRPSFLQWVTDKYGWFAVNIIGYCLYADSELPTALLVLMIAMSVFSTEKWSSSSFTVSLISMRMSA